MTSAPPAVARAGWKNFGEGFLLGGIAGMMMWMLNLDVLIQYFQHLVIVAAVLGGLVGLTRFRRAIRLVNAILLGVIMIVAYTPIAGVLLHSLDRSDEAVPADAVVVLAAGFANNDAIGAHAQDRFLHGLILVHQGLAPELVLTRPTDPGGIWPTEARKEMAQLGIECRVEDVGPVRNTHDEAVAIAQMFRDRGWHRVILVTHRWHMRRAAALLEKQNVSVICSPCSDSTFDESGTMRPSDRLTAFGDWLHEEVGMFVYRLRGWI